MDIKLYLSKIISMSEIEHGRLNLIYSDLKDKNNANFGILHKPIDEFISGLMHSSRYTIGEYDDSSVYSSF